MRRATEADHLKRVNVLISIHALHEESDPDRVDLIHSVVISIHALHEESVD